MYLHYYSIVLAISLPVLQHFLSLFLSPPFTISFFFLIPHFTLHRPIYVIYFIHSLFTCYMYSIYKACRPIYICTDVVYKYTYICAVYRRMLSFHPLFKITPFTSFPSSILFFIPFFLHFGRIFWVLTPEHRKEREREEIELGWGFSTLSLYIYLILYRLNGVATDQSINKVSFFPLFFSMIIIYFSPFFFFFFYITPSIYQTSVILYCFIYIYPLSFFYISLTNITTNCMWKRHEERERRGNGVFTLYGTHLLRYSLARIYVSYMECMRIKRVRELIDKKKPHYAQIYTTL